MNRPFFLLNDRREGGFMYIGDTLAVYALQNPEKPAIVFEGEAITYSQFYDEIKVIQSKLRAYIPDVKGKKIAFLLGNEPRFLKVFFATITVGGIAMPLDPKWSSRELGTILQEVEPALVLVADDLIGKVPSSAASKILCWTDFEQLDDHDFSFEPPSGKRNAEDLFYIGFTSGTTGIPKGYKRTHLSWLKSFENGNEVFQISRDDIICTPGPLYHSLNLYGAVHALHLGATLSLMNKFSAPTVIDLLDKALIDVLYLVPTMASALMKQLESAQKQFERLKMLISSGAKWHPNSRKKINSFFPNASLYEFYGASETSFISVLSDDDYLLAPLSVGKAFPGVEIQIRTNERNIAEVGEIGKVYIKSEMVFDGYVNNDEANAKTLHGEWATVGDIGYVDKKGFLFLVGREKNMIISGGLNIYPEEIELFLEKHEDIDEAVVVGVPHSYWGEMAVALVKCKIGKKFDPEKLKTYCRKTLSSYKCPRLFIEVEHFPYTTSGKIARQEVLKYLEELLEKR